MLAIGETFYYQLTAMLLPTILTLAATAACYNISESRETPYVRNYFYAGGEYVSDGDGGHIFHNQMYVERLSPLGGATKPFPMVFIHGQAQTGTVRRLPFNALVA